MSYSTSVTTAGTMQLGTITSQTYSTKKLPDEKLADSPKEQPGDNSDVAFWPGLAEWLRKFWPSGSEQSNKKIEKNWFEFRTVEPLFGSQTSRIADFKPEYNINSFENMSFDPGIIGASSIQFNDVNLANKSFNNSEFKETVTINTDNLTGTSFENIKIRKNSSLSIGPRITITSDNYGERRTPNRRTTVENLSFANASAERVDNQGQQQDTNGKLSFYAFQELINSDFSNMDLPIDMGDLKLTRANFKNSNLAYSKFSSVTFGKGNNFNGADLYRVNLDINPENIETTTLDFSRAKDITGLLIGNITSQQTYNSRADKMDLIIEKITLPPGYTFVTSMAEAQNHLDSGQLPDDIKTLLKGMMKDSLPSGRAQTAKAIDEEGNHDPTRHSLCQPIVLPTLFGAN